MLPAHRPPTHPGEMLLKEFLEPLGVSQVDAAQRMRVPFQRLNAIVKGRHAVSADGAPARGAHGVGRRDLAELAGEVGPVARAARSGPPTQGEAATGAAS